MRDAGTLSPTEFPDYNWDETSLVEVKVYANSLPAAAEPPLIGHNRPQDDPGVDQTYRVGFEIPNYVSRDSVAVFQLALQEQGDHKHRLDALDQAAYRARANGDISAAAYWLYEVVRVASEGKHRCCLWDLDKIGFVAGGIDRARVSKLLTELETAKLVVILKFTKDVRSTKLPQAVHCACGNG